MLYKVCNSFVEMGSANVQATDYLKGVGQYFPLSASPRLLSPTLLATGQQRLFGLPHVSLSSMEKWGLGKACLGILSPGECGGYLPSLPTRQHSYQPWEGLGQGHADNPLLPQPPCLWSVWAGQPWA